MGNLSVLCDIIILVAAVLVAITNIYNFFFRSGKFIKKKVNQAEETKEAELNARIDARAKEIVQPMIDAAVRNLTSSFEGLLDKHLPERLEEHDKETRIKYLADRQRYLEQIKDEVVCVMKDRIDAVDEHGDQMKVFSEVMKELLRERIMEIYRRNKKEGQLETHERYELKQAYASYKSIGGNSYIDEYYETMDQWTIVPDNH